MTGSEPSGAVGDTRAPEWARQFALARTLVAEGRSRDAVAPLVAAATLNPELTPAWRMLGDIHLAADRFGEARTAYDRRLASMIADPHLKAVADELSRNRPAPAERAAHALLALSPAHPAPAIHLLGEAVRRQGRLTEAEAILVQCVTRWPHLHLARQTYALTLIGLRRWAEAVVHLDRLLTRDPADHRSRMMKAAALTELGDYGSAATVTEEVLAAFPDQPRAWLIHGAGLRSLGRTAEAVAAFRRCLDLDPDCGEAWWALANLKTHRFDSADRAAMRARLGGAGPDLAAHLEFALGKAEEDAGAVEPAFAHYLRGNAIVRGARAYDPAATTALVDASRALYTAEFLAQSANWGADAPDPIFIVGLPRSGSTLVDQILASHPAIEGTRELPDIDMIAGAIGEPYPERMGRLDRDACAALGRAYMERTAPLRRLGRGRFTDKAPGNFLHAGLILTILPNARIIDVRRHPLACCVSAFRQHFAGGFAFAYDLTDLGAYYADYVRLMAHFDAVAPGRIHRVIYEDLVVETADETRRLLDYLGLPFDPACLRFYDNPRAVATPSSEQVRQPIFTDAVDHWRRFEPWLEPLKAALGPVLETYPAG